MSQKESYIENEHVEFWIEDGIILEIFKPNVKNLTLPMAKAIVRDRLKVSNGITRPLLIDSMNCTSVDKDARDYFETDESLKYLEISAIVVHNHIALFVGKLFLRVFKTKFKVELFKTRISAMNFLKELK